MYVSFCDTSSKDALSFFLYVFIVQGFIAVFIQVFVFISVMLHSYDFCHFIRVDLVSVDISVLHSLLLMLLWIFSLFISLLLMSSSHTLVICPLSSPVIYILLCLSVSFSGSILYFTILKKNSANTIPSHFLHAAASW